MFGSLGLFEAGIVFGFIALVGIISIVLKRNASSEDYSLPRRTAFIGQSAASAAPLQPTREGMTKGPGEKYCQECGSIIRAKAEICPRCGVRQGVESSSGRNRVAAALFALLLGGIGIHKFYLGKVLQGVVYLLFCWTFVPFIVSVIEGIVYLTMTDADFAAKYG